MQEAVVSSHIAFARNPQYWPCTTTIDGAEYALPFIDEMIMPNLPDETTQIASLRTGQLDIMGTVSVKYRETLADTSPDLQSQGWVEIWPVVVELNHNNENLANILQIPALSASAWDGGRPGSDRIARGVGLWRCYPVAWTRHPDILGKSTAGRERNCHTYNPDTR